MEKVRLIDANALVDKLLKVDLDHDERITKSGAVADMVCLISNAPTIEAEPVRHGRWILVIQIVSPYGAEIEEKCSLCGCDISRYGTQPMYKFCPNCGAKMDGG